MKQFFLTGIDFKNNIVIQGHAEETHVMGLIGTIMTDYDKEGKSLPEEAKERMRHLWSLETVDDLFDVWEEFEDLSLFLQEITWETESNDFPWKSPSSNKTNS